MQTPAPSAQADMEASVAPSPSTQGDIDMQAGESSADSSVTASMAVRLPWSAALRSRNCPPPASARVVQPVLPA